MLLIVRHGRTVANASGLLQGRVDNPLDDRGRQQAKQISAALGPIDVVVSSPLQRARETAGPLGLPVRIDERWIELDYGEWDELPITDVSADQWTQWRNDPMFAPPGGESLAELDRRVVEACDDLVGEATELNVAVFTHVSPIKSAISWALGVNDPISWRLHVGQAQISRILIRDGRPVLNSFNETWHLNGP
ncbi:MAG: histidine phosphatase family protein [Actinomycetota bacterium]|nr:histidine phosphatase family protein [Actinomycetota bacterium]MEC9059178.1 histidine phosphatase family protein [Actinomycetota bacterium]MEC9473607.1 histidine phosphatase family protein [Actinomycetota bacterium]